MCGINGALRLAATAPPVDPDELVRTQRYQQSRGPDGSGSWFSPDGRVALANNRLAILDPSLAGAQPMASVDGRYTITFNGEIYNFRDLREELAAEGISFRSHGDTEVVLAMFARHGVAMLPRLRGMFAFAIWDDEAKALLLARDPFGIKPLYYSLEAGTLRFASQFKALVAGGALSKALDLGALAGFLVWGSVPEPFTLRQSIRQLPAGHYLVAQGGQLSEPRAIPSPEPTAGRAAEALSLADALAESVAAHMVSDVPVAVFLSSGLDSGLVAGLARRYDPDLTTLTIRFESLRGTAADEGPIAAHVAAELGTRHREVLLPKEALPALWPSALAAMDQPTIDGFNSYLISQAAHQAGFKVVLSGLGGDELLGGYPSFRHVPRMVRATRAARVVPGLAALWPHLAAASGRPKALGLFRYGSTLAGAYLLRRALFLPEELPALLGAGAAEEALRRYDPLADAARALSDRAVEVPSELAGSPWAAVHRLETALYLRNQLLRDSDWASMAWSVELRVPLVDGVLHRHGAANGFAPARAGGKSAVVRQAVPELPIDSLPKRKSGFYVPLAEALADDAGGLSHGARSRRLALAVLASHGIELPVNRAAEVDPVPEQERLAG